MYNVIITAIENERDNKKLSVRKMALILGLNQQTLDRILKGKRGIGAKTFLTIMQARPEWWGLINGSAPADNPDGRQPGNTDNDNRKLSIQGEKP